MFYSPKNTFDQSNSLEKWARCLGDPFNRNNSIVEHLHKLSCKCANYSRLATLLLEYVKLSHISNLHICNELLESLGCPSVKLNSWCEHKGQFYMNITKFHLYLIKYIWCSCKVCIELHGNYWLESTPSHELPTQQNHDHFPIWHIFTQFNHLQIAWLMCCA
jgi:hypothetical protein